MSEQEPRIAPEEQEKPQPTTTTTESKKQDKKTKGKPRTGGTDVESVLQAGKHAVPVTTKGAAVLQSMEARGKTGQGTETSKHKEEGGLVPKVQSAAAKGGEVVTQSQEEYASVKAAEEVAKKEGLYTTRREKKEKKKQQQQQPGAGGEEEMVEIWPDKKDVVQLISMVEHAGTLRGISLKKGEAVARLQGAADRGRSCKVPKKVADLLVEATLQRPKDLKTRAEAQMLRMEYGKEKLGEGGKGASSGGGGSTGAKKATPQLVRTFDKLTVDVPMSPVVQPQRPQQMWGGASEGDWEEEG